MITYEGESLYPKEYQSENINTETINNSNIINTNTTGNNVVLKKVQSKKKVYTANKLTPSIIGFFKKQIPPISHVTVEDISAASHVTVEDNNKDVLIDTTTHEYDNSDIMVLLEEGVDCFHLSNETVMVDQSVSRGYDSIPLKSVGATDSLSRTRYNTRSTAVSGGTIGITHTHTNTQKHTHTHTSVPLAPLFLSKKDKIVSKHTHTYIYIYHCV
eukprot:GHVR01134243.1.p1 GENE.GHVR01134243.1~~GHVR01134243.1.p1  ORF type:complete len:215 (+),score=77.52 GHVR01134243.1:108-752(+)